MHMELVSFDSNIIYIIITLIVTLPKKKLRMLLLSKIKPNKGIISLLPQPCLPNLSSDCDPF
jgi:hypothetical protein